MASLTTARVRPITTSIPATHRILFLALCLGMLARFALDLYIDARPLGGDARSYIAAARAVVAGDELYGSEMLPHLAAARTRFPYLYPPLLAVLLSPLAQLPLLPATYLCVALAGAATLALGVALSRLVGWRTAVVGVWIFPPTWSTIMLGQINALVALLLTLALLDLLQRREYRAGVWLALGAVLKVTPVLSLISFAWRGQRKPLLSAAGAGVLGIMLTLPVVGLRAWIAGMVAAVQHGWPTGGLVSWTGLLSTPEGSASLLGLSISGVLVAVTLLRSRHVSGPLAVAAATLLPLLIARITWEHHMVMALPALALLWTRGQHFRALAQVAWVLIGLIGGPIIAPVLTVCLLVCCWPRWLDRVPPDVAIGAQSRESADVFEPR